MPSPPSAYGRAFWFAYLANTSLMVAVSLLFRYADFVTVLGGGEWELGWIVGIGTVGSLLMRLAQGVSIDRYGPRAIWLGSLVGIIAMLLAHLAISRVDSFPIYLVRIVYHTCLAGAFGASITYISLRAPVVRMAEIVGMLGSSGFVGMAIGSQLSDWLCGPGSIGRSEIARLFLVAAGMATCSLVCAITATHGAVRPLRRKRPPLFWLVRRYHPGMMLVIAIAVGAGIGLPGTFLRPYTAQLGIAGIGAFFVVYSATAFVARILLRRLPDRLGPRKTAIIGMGFLIVSLLCYMLVRVSWQLALPGVVAGIAHALLFPSMVAGGSASFPARHRGVGVTLTLAMFDLGNLLGMPAAGAIVELSGRAGLPGYSTMFLSMAAMLSGACLIFVAFSARKASRAARKSTRSKQQHRETAEAA